MSLCEYKTELKKIYTKHQFTADKIILSVLAVIEVLECEVLKETH